MAYVQAFWAIGDKKCHCMSLRGGRAMRKAQRVHFPNLFDEVPRGSSRHYDMEVARDRLQERLEGEMTPLTRVTRRGSESNPLETKSTASCLRCLFKEDLGVADRLIDTRKPMDAFKSATAKKPGHFQWWGYVEVSWESALICRHST